MFFSRSFTVSGLTFKSLTHEYILVCGIRQESNYILLPVDIQFSPYYLLNRLPFPPLCILGTLTEDLLTVIFMDLFLGSLLCSIISMYVFMLVPYCFDYCSFVLSFEIRKCDASSFVLFAQNCFGYLGSFVIPYEF